MPAANADCQYEIAAAHDTATRTHAQPQSFHGCRWARPMLPTQPGNSTLQLPPVCRPAPRQPPGLFHSLALLLAPHGLHHFSRERALEDNPLRLTRSELDFELAMDVTMALQCQNGAVLAVGAGVGEGVGGRRGRGRVVIELCSRRRRSSVDVKFATMSRTAASAHGVRCGGPLAAQDHDRFEESALLFHAVERSREGRDWRVYASENGSSSHRGEDSATGGLHATVEKADDNASTQEKDTQRFRSSEASCDEGSSFLAVESVLESEGGKSVDDYKLRAHIFSESAIFFAALKDRNSHSAVQ